jgi:hypothetical protein
LIEVEQGESHRPSAPSGASKSAREHLVEGAPIANSGECVGASQDGCAFLGSLSPQEFEHGDADDRGEHAEQDADSNQHRPLARIGRDDRCPEVHCCEDKAENQGAA